MATFEKRKRLPSFISVDYIIFTSIYSALVWRGQAHAYRVFENFLIILLHAATRNVNAGKVHD